LALKNVKILLIKKIIIIKKYVKKNLTIVIKKIIGIKIKIKIK
jgi:hypothetical protein